MLKKIKLLKKIHKDKVNYLKKVLPEMRRNIDPESIDAADSGINEKLTNFSTHICTSGNECPTKLGNIRDEYRCKNCEKAIGTVGHLRAIAMEYGKMTRMACKQ